MKKERVCQLATLEPNVDFRLTNVAREYILFLFSSLLSFSLIFCTYTRTLSNYCHVISQRIKYGEHTKNQRKRKWIRAFRRSGHSYYHVLRWRWELGPRGNPPSTSLPTIKRPEQPGNTVLAISPVSPGHTCRRRSYTRRNASRASFPSYILRLYLTRPRSPSKAGTVEVKPKRDKSIDILFARNDRSLSTREIYYCTNAGISWRTLTADSYRSSLLPRWLSATYPT